MTTGRVNRVWLRGAAVLVGFGLTLSACNGEFDTQVRLGQENKCELEVASAKLAKNPKDLVLDDQVKRLIMRIESHEEVSGNPSKFREKIKQHKCP